MWSSADALNVSGLPTLRALGSPRGQHVMRPTPGPPSTREGLGAVHDHPGDPVVRFRRRKRRREVADRLPALGDKPPTDTLAVAWDHAATHADEELDAVVRAAAGRWVRRSLPTYSPGLNPIERRWRPCRRDVPHGERCASLDALWKAAHASFDRDNQGTERVLSIIGAHAA